MNDKQDFTTGSIPVKMIRFMIPIFGALVLQAMYGAVDLVIVGKFGTTAGISGVSTGSSAINLVTFTISGLAMGVTVLIGRYLGEGKQRRIGKVLGGVVAFFAIVAIVLTVGLLIFARPLAMLLQAPEEALDLTVLYIRICGGGIVFVIAYNVIACIFRGLGNSRLPLIFVLIACIVNVFGDLFLVAVLHMNVAGAALATIGAQAVSVILSLVIIRRQDLPFSFSISDIGFSGEIARFVRLGSPLALQELLTNGTFLAICAFVNHLGLECSSGYGVSQKIINFIMLIPSSIMQSMSSFVAQNVGAGKEKRAVQVMTFGMGMGFVIGAFIAYFAYFHGDIMASIFTDDPQVILRSAEYLKGFAPEAMITCILFSYIGYFSGHGKSLFVMAQGIAQSLLIRLPFSYFMSNQPDPSLVRIAWAAPLSTVFGIVICTIYFLMLRGKLRQRDRH